MNEENNTTSNVVNRNYYPDDTLDLAQLFRIYLKKWLFLGCSSLVVAIVAFLGLKFFYNKSAREWKVNFEFEFPGIEAGLYPDGTTFKYQDFVKKEVIEGAIASDPAKFKFTADDVLKNAGLGVVMNYTENAQKEKVFTGVYTLTMKQSFFRSGNQAGDFAEALLQALADEIAKQADNVYYHAYLDAFDNADTFQVMLSQLVNQKAYVDAKYDEWIEAYGEQYTVNGSTLSKHKQNALMAMTDKEYSALRYELTKKQYVYSKTGDDVAVCKFQIEILNDEYEDNAKKIASLTSALEDLRKGEGNSDGMDLTGKPNETYYYQTIATLTERQVDIEREISNINIKIANMNADSEANAYYNKIMNIRAKLEKQATVLETAVAKRLYTEKTVFHLGGLKSNGGFSSVIGAGAAFVLTYLVVGFCVFIMDEDDKKKKKTA